MKLQIALFFLVGVTLWNGVEHLVAKAEAQALENIYPILTLEQLAEIPVDKI